MSDPTGTILIAGNNGNTPAQAQQVHHHMKLKRRDPSGAPNRMYGRYLNLLYGPAKIYTKSPQIPSISPTPKPFCGICAKTMKHAPEIPAWALVAGGTLGRGGLHSDSRFTRGNAEMAKKIRNRSTVVDKFTRLANSKLGRMSGPAGCGVQSVVNWQGYRDKGNTQTESTIKTTIEMGSTAAGGVVGAGLGMMCVGWAVVCSPTLAVGFGIVGGYSGRQLNETADPTISWLAGKIDGSGR